MPTRKRTHQKRKSHIKGGNEAGYQVEPDPMIRDIQQKLNELEMNMPIHIGKVFVANATGGQRQIQLYVPKNISKSDFMALFVANAASYAYINLQSVYTLPNVRGIPISNVNTLFSNGGPIEDNSIISRGNFILAEERYPGLFIQS